MKTFARIEQGAVAELFATDHDVASLFHPSLKWVDVTGNAAAQIGWVMLPSGELAAPAASAVPQGAAIESATVESIQAQLTALQAALVALARPPGTINDHPSNRVIDAGGTP